MFYGREYELQQLKALLQKDTASLVVIRGRRRIGKSTLVEMFAESFGLFCEFQGLAPRAHLNDDDQRRNFSEQMGKIFKIPPLKLDHWTEAFSHLASHTRKGRVLIFLDEISWMAGTDGDFLGKLKIAWDTEFKKNPKLVLVLCGSVSSWIDNNILKDADFVGRVSLEINLQELSLKDCHQFWKDKKGRISSMEKAKILCAVGGVPKYLEEINFSESAEKNIQRLFFKQSGLLFNEFDKVFADIFSKRAARYKEIARILVSGKFSTLEIAKKMGLPQNGDITEYLTDLEKSDFLSRDYIWQFDGKKSRMSRYRIRDNYLRFYLKYVEPISEKIRSGLYETRGLESLKNWPVIFGLQFENLILNNLSAVLNHLGIDPNSVISASPYFQRKTKGNKGACQIDLLIHTRFSTLYLCEIKFRAKIAREVMDEVVKKMNLLKRPKGMSIRPVLIYEGEISDEVLESDFFDRIISFKDLL